MLGTACTFSNATGIPIPAYTKRYQMRIVIRYDAKVKVWIVVDEAF